MKFIRTMRQPHHRRAFVVITRQRSLCFRHLCQVCSLIVALLCVPVLIRVSQHLSPDAPLKPKPGVVRFHKGCERESTKFGLLETALLAPGANGLEHGVDVCPRHPLDALLVGARLIAHSRALRGPPSSYSV
jgi:hypothetical protein